MTVLVDTPILVDHLRGDPRAVELLRRLAEDEAPILAATPTRTELIAGVRLPERQAMHELLGSLAWVDITVDVADAAGEYARRFLRSHPGIDTVDYLVAAAATTIGARLLTLNVRHFPMFEGLEPAYR